MALRVLQAGVSTTVQDRGRIGYRGVGVPVGGAFDRGSLDLANAMLGNEPDAAVLEMTLVGGSYRAEVPLAIALTGAPMSALIRSASGPDRTLVIPATTTLEPGDELVIGGSPHGARTYLAVQGGWRTNLVLGSRSSETCLKIGDLLPALPGSTPTRRPVAWPWAVSENRKAIRIIDGTDADPGDARILESGEYRVASQSNRMGLRLEGPPIPREAEPNRASAPIAAGAIQVTGGRAIILGVAGGTMGGYLHLAHIIHLDLDRLAQLRPGDRVTFHRIEVEEARQLDRLNRIERARWHTIIRRTQDSGLRTEDSGLHTQDELSLSPKTHPQPSPGARVPSPES